MRPFRFFFGLSIAVILFFFVARVLIFAFIIAAVLSIVYALIRRIRDFITYDRNGEYYIPAYNRGYVDQTGVEYNRQNEVEPLFYDDRVINRRPANNIQFVDIN